jgi:hypothetical protein
MMHGRKNIKIIEERLKKHRTPHVSLRRLVLSCLSCSILFISILVIYDEDDQNML